MPGLIGFYTVGEGRENWDASHFIHYGLNALQGRGQESVSLATIGQGNTLHTLSGKGGVEEFFQKNRASIPKGFIGIGQTSSYLEDYLVTLKRLTRWFSHLTARQIFTKTAAKPPSSSHA